MPCSGAVHAAGGNQGGRIMPKYSVFWENRGVLEHEDVELAEPAHEASELATKRWLAARGRAEWSEAEENAYWADFDRRNPITAYRRDCGELEFVDHGRYGNVANYTLLRCKESGRSVDGAKFVRVEGG